MGRSDCACGGCDGPRRLPKWLGGAICAALGAAALAGCEPPYDYVLRDNNGQPIRVEAVTDVLTDPDLTEQEQREALRALGIANENLIDVLIRQG